MTRSRLADNSYPMRISSAATTLLSCSVSQRCDNRCLRYLRNGLCAQADSQQRGVSILCGKLRAGPRLSYVLGQRAADYREHQQNSNESTHRGFFRFDLSLSHAVKTDRRSTAAGGGNSENGPSRANNLECCGRSLCGSLFATHRWKSLFERRKTIIARSIVGGLTDEFREQPQSRLV